MRAILATLLIGASASAQEVSLVEAPGLRITNPTVLRSASLAEHAKSVWQEHLRTEEGDLRVSLGANTGFWGQSVELTFTVEAGQLRAVRVSGRWWTDAGNPGELEGDFLDLRGRVLVNTTDIASAESLDIAFVLTGEGLRERVPVNGEARVDLTLPTAKLSWWEERFGYDLALEGDLAAIAAESGTHVFERANGHWKFRDVLPVSGWVAISESTLAVLVSTESGEETAPTLHLYDTRELAPIAVLEVPPDGLDRPHCGPMAFEGENLLVRQRVYGEQPSARVLAFRRAGTEWRLVQRIPSPDSEDEDFGEAVALCGDTAVISRFTYERRDDSWDFAGELPWPRPPLNSRGRDVAIADRVVAAGAPHDGGGAVYVYRRNQGSWAEPVRVADTARYFGVAVEVDEGWGSGPVVVAAAQNEVCVLTQTDGQWAIAGRLSVEASGHFLDDLGVHEFGSAVAVSAKTILVGAPEFRAYAEKPRCGAVIVYDFVDGRWLQTAQLSPQR